MGWGYLGDRTGPKSGSLWTLGPFKGHRRPLHSRRGAAKSLSRDGFPGVGEGKRLSELGKRQ